MGSASLLTQECLDRAALPAPSFTETRAWWDVLLLSEFCASEGDVPDPGECLYLLLLLSRDSQNLQGAVLETQAFRSLPCFAQPCVQIFPIRKS